VEADAVIEELGDLLSLLGLERHDQTRAPSTEDRISNDSK
jgi:hypothetical protein